MPSPRALVVPSVASFLISHSFWLTGALAATPTTRESPASLSVLVAQAEARNPELVVTRQQWEVAKAGAGYAGSLEAPRLNAAVMNLPTFGGPSLSLTQAIPFGAKRQLMSTAASRQVDVAAAEYERQRWSVISELKQAYYDYATLHQAIRIHHLIHDQLQYLQAIATKKYAAGLGQMQDAVRAQLEISRLHSSQFSLEQRQQTALARLNTLVARPLDTPVALPAELAPPDRLPDEAALVAQAEAHNPMLLALKAQVAGSESQRSLVQVETTVPDVDLGLQAGRSMPGEMTYVGGMVGISLPWLTPYRNDQRVAEATRTLETTQARYEAQVNEQRFKIRELRNQLIQSQRQIDLARRGLLPQSIQAVNASLAAYQVNKVDFATVAENQKAVLEAQMDDVMSRGDFYKTWASLEAVVGRSIDEATGGRP